MKKRWLKALKVIIPVVIIVAVITWFVIWSAAPKQGTISNGNSTSKTPTTYYDKTLEGTYMKFQYSGKYIVRNDGAKDADLERYTLSADTRYDKRILASVTELPDGQLGSNGSYIFRQKSSSLYSYRKVQVGGNLVEVWVKKDGTEQTTIMPHGNKAAVISFVTANTNDDLTTEMDALLNTFSWKQ